MFSERIELSTLTFGKALSRLINPIQKTPSYNQLRSLLVRLSLQYFGT